MTVTITQNVLTQGDALKPQETDILTQFGSLPAPEPVPEGWTVLTGNSLNSLVARVVYRYEAEIT